MPDAIFDDPRLAAVYDAFEGDRSDLTAYRAIIGELGATSVLDIGCGTGVLALMLAADGVAVHAVDPAGASLDVARSKPGAHAVRWHRGTVEDLPSLRVDVAVMTGNVAQVFTEDSQWDETLRVVHQMLRPGGHLVFESRRPERRAWEDWERDAAPVQLHVEGVGDVIERFELTGVALPLVSFRHRCTFAADATTVTSESTLIFRSRTEIEQTLRTAGFVVREVRDAPDRPGREHVFIAQRD
ncbi:bifunctional 2-polyprenyl-6-hydroxyphenol methylase/3-demethylubiquinol 3-O-methyltransferase UbiG [Allobranchiibius sp. GilTou73]|uniref:class I SAM-dependent methyltransferase n=1 Tax=Allobranchiibius sp. GilTou73 TaxID=2904523 RepID=UPI001F2F0439|nr:class I SAM-dependent methyltransferase [Allobranchiibius sp. GilTou73]UIJ36393.1 class I SAM-dependent methyltransferase [Allobranchiibius sp. GilTou73]